MPEYRITVIGAGAVGKTAVTTRFIQGKFVERYDPTIEDSYRKQVDLDGLSCMLDIMDTAGQEEYTALRDQFMRRGDGFVLMYSVINSLTFEATLRLHQTIILMKQAPNFPTVLVGNKRDMEGQRQVTEAEGKEVARKWQMPFFETSAKSNDNINQWHDKYNCGALLRVTANGVPLTAKGTTEANTGSGKRSKCVML